MLTQSLNVLEDVNSDPVSATRLLKFTAISNVPAIIEPFVESEFYQTRTGLYISPRFADRIDFSKTEDSAPERSYMALHPKVKACARDIRLGLPASHLSTRKDIASFIKAQWRGQSGFLLTNGYSNLFYALDKNGEVFGVCVRRLIVPVEWGVDTWDINDVNCCWEPKHQVLCPFHYCL